jgi:murein DD-endopeptidase MepM/ murein hydrolase activator NlpD
VLPRWPALVLALVLALVGAFGCALVGAPAGAAAAPPAAPAAPVTRAADALWTLPLPGPPSVARRFDPPSEPWRSGHRGVDLAAAEGAAVLAAGSGVVVFAGEVGGRPVVSVAHEGGLRTTYEPVLPAVRAGQAVARGSPLGTLLAGHAGCPAAACLHWGLRRGETYLDPLALLRPPRLRLLPWRGPDVPGP